MGIPKVFIIDSMLIAQHFYEDFLRKLPFRIAGEIPEGILWHTYIEACYQIFDVLEDNVESYWANISKYGDITDLSVYRYIEGDLDLERDLAEHFKTLAMDIWTAFYHYGLFTLPETFMLMELTVTHMVISALSLYE